MWEEEAWKLLEESIIYYQERLYGCCPRSGGESTQLRPVFYPRFRPLSLGMHGRTEIVRNFLIETLAMQSHDRRWIALRQDQV